MSNVDYLKLLISASYYSFYVILMRYLFYEASGFAAEESGAYEYSFGT